MKILFYILLISLNMSCNGQEKSIVEQKKPSQTNALRDYQKQKQHLEFKAFNMFYNIKNIKLGTVANFVEKFGKPDFINFGDLIYSTTPINPSAHLDSKVDKFGNYLVIVGNDEFPINDKNGKRIEENYAKFIDKSGKDAFAVDKNDIPLGQIYSYRIWMSPYETFSSYKDEPSLAKAKIPTLNGYIKINGKLIHQSITKKELVKQLQPLPDGGQLVGMLGDPVLIYDLGDKGKDFDPNIDPQDARVFIDFVFKTDPKTKEEKGLYYINYYYSLKPKEKAKK